MWCKINNIRNNFETQKYRIIRKDAECNKSWEIGNKCNIRALHIRTYIDVFEFELEEKSAYM